MYIYLISHKNSDFNDNLFYIQTKTVYKVTKGFFFNLFIFQKLSYF